MDLWTAQAEGLRGRIERGEAFKWFAPQVDGPPGETPKNSTTADTELPSPEATQEGGAMLLGSVGLGDDIARGRGDPGGNRFVAVTTRTSQGETGGKEKGQGGEGDQFCHGTLLTEE